MKPYQLLGTFFISSLLVIGGGNVVFAQESNSSDNAKNIIETIDEKIPEPVKEKTKGFFNQLDGWRESTEQTLVAKRESAKQDRDAKRESISKSVEENRDRVLEGESTSLVSGTGGRVNAHVVFASIWVWVTSLLTFVFAQKFVFYALLVLLILGTLRSIYHAFRKDPYSLSS